MSKIFFVGFFMLVSSTIAFILAILTPYWILNANNVRYRGIFEVCVPDSTTGDGVYRKCADILLYSQEMIFYRLDYAIACASLSIAASSLGIILIWISGLHMCLKDKMNINRTARLRTSETLIALTLLTDCITIVVWVVMLAKNLDYKNMITTAQIGWSLWLAVGSTGGYLIALIFFCIHRIDLGASYNKRSASYNDSREYLQRF